MGELHELTLKLENAENSEGESEIREAYLARANFFMRIGERGAALVAFETTFAKTVALGPRLDVLLSMLCVGLFYESLPLIKTTLDRAKALLEEGGDWERRNRLKVYEAVFLILVRDFKGASSYTFRR